MPDEIYRETWIVFPSIPLSVVGLVLLAAGIALILWTEIIVGVVIAFLGVIAILIGLALVSAGFIMGRSRVPPALLFIAGFASILVGIFSLVRPDLVADLVIYLSAAIGILVGAFLLFIGAILSLPGWGRRSFLASGIAFLVAGIALAVFPGPTSRFLLDAGGVILAGTGCVALFIAYTRRRAEQATL